jgi:hypothetical protein
MKGAVGQHEHEHALLVALRVGSSGATPARSGAGLAALVTLLGGVALLAGRAPRVWAAVFVAIVGGCAAAFWGALLSGAWWAGAGVVTQVEVLGTQIVSVCVTGACVYLLRTRVGAARESVAASGWAQFALACFLVAYVPVMYATTLGCTDCDLLGIFFGASYVTCGIVIVSASAVACAMASASASIVRDCADSLLGCKTAAGESGIDVEEGGATGGRRAAGTAAGVYPSTSLRAQVGATVRAAFAAQAPAQALAMVIYTRVLVALAVLVGDIAATGHVSLPLLIVEAWVPACGVWLAVTASGVSFEFERLQTATVDPESGDAAVAAANGRAEHVDVALYLASLQAQGRLCFTVFGVALNRTNLARVVVSLSTVAVGVWTRSYGGAAAVA